MFRNLCGSMARQRNAGFALPAAIFLLLVVGMLVLLMSRLAVNQDNASDLAVQQARAWQAARSALDWAVHQSWTTGACPAGSPGFAGTPLAGFSAVVSCTPRIHVDERGNSLQLFVLQVSASNGTPGSRPDYAWRRIEGVVER